MEAVLLFGGSVVALLGLLIWAEKRERRERREWYRAYQARGGLIGALMRNWRPVPRLTDRRNLKESD